VRRGGSLALGFAAAIVVIGGTLLWALPGRIVDGPFCESVVRSTTSTEAVCLSPAQRLEAENQVRTTILQASGGLLFFVTAFLSWTTIVVNREGATTHRLNEAITHFDGESEERRLGAIVALGRHARLGADASAVATIVAAFARRRFPRPTSLVAPDADDITSLRSRSPGLQLALEVLGGPHVPTTMLDLTRIDARKAELRGADLTGALLDEANLNAADLENADLRGASLRGTDLRYATLRKAKLQGADLSYALVEGADFSEATIDTDNPWAGVEWHEATVPPSGVNPV
jgi:uncharacterized protein YjbI with pentapeptide repeats